MSIRHSSLSGRFPPSSGGTSEVKEPGHFEVRKSSSQVTRMHFFPHKSLPVLSCRTQNTGRQHQSHMVTFLFSVHTVTEAKQQAGLGRAGARAVGPGV